MGTPEDPTRRIPPTEPPRRVVEHEREYTDEHAWRAEIADRLRSLRTALAAVGIIAALAFALALYAFATRDDDDDDRAPTRDPAAAAQLRDLDERIEELESKLDNRATEGDLEDITKEQSELADRLGKVERSAERDNGSEETEQLESRLDDLSADIDQLTQRVDEVEQEEAP